MKNNTIQNKTIGVYYAKEILTIKIDRYKKNIGTTHNTKIYE